MVGRVVIAGGVQFSYVIILGGGSLGGVQFSYVIISGGNVLIHHTFLTTPAPLWDVINDRSLTKYMKRENNTILDDTDSADRHNFVPSQSFTGSSPGNFSQGDQ